VQIIGVNTLSKTKQKNKIAVVLLSGGLDSTTMATKAKKDGYQVLAISFRYGQVLSKEISCAQEVAQKLGIGHKIIDITNYKDLAWYSALTHPELFDIPKERKIENMAKNIPITYVPMRNTFFIVMAAAYLESEILNKIEKEDTKPYKIEARIFIAANALDFSGYPDCRPEYYKRMNSLMKLTSKASIQYKVQMKIETPLLHMTKKNIAQLGTQIGAPLSWTWSCYEGGDVPCGKCDSCQLRERGFKELGIEDPLLARLREEGKL